MQIALDGRTLLSNQPRGTGKAFTEVYGRLAAKHVDWKFLLLHRSRSSSGSACGQSPNIETRFLEMRGDRLNLWQSLGLPWQASRAHADVLHCPANTGPRWSPTPTLVTIHDLIPLQAEFRGSSWRQWAARVGRIARQARYVTTPSEFSRIEIMRTFGIPEARVIAIPWAASSTCRPPRQREDQNRIRAKYGVDRDRPYVLVFGAEDPRKNTRRILEAWSGLSTAQRADAVLVIVGMQEKSRQKLSGDYRSTENARSIRLHGYIPENDVPELLGSATFLCFPSLYEGFGLPILDAFASETAVLTSRNSSIPEVAGDAAIYVDPHSAPSIADGMASLLSDGALRAQLIAAGRRQATKFSWDRCASQYADVIQRFA